MSKVARKRSSLPIIPKSSTHNRELVVTPLMPYMEKPWDWAMFAKGFFIVNTLAHPYGIRDLLLFVLLIPLCRRKYHKVKGKKISVTIKHNFVGKSHHALLTMKCQSALFSVTPRFRDTLPRHVAAALHNNGCLLGSSCCKATAERLQIHGLSARH